MCVCVCVFLHSLCALSVAGNEVITNKDVYKEQADSSQLLSVAVMHIYIFVVITACVSVCRALRWPFSYTRVAEYIQYLSLDW